VSESIVVKAVTKEFTLRHGKTLKQTVVRRARGQDTTDTFKAVDDVSFTVQQGESIALMGLNGSGKSTLLRLVSGVMNPDAGQVLTRGRIAGLIGVGAGFHPQLTGRDNVYLNGAILGMSKPEIDAKFDDIVTFADIGKFLDTEVNHYSSGMYSRLGFAVAIHTDCDIFLIDEVLAVGDRPFRRKCMRRIEAMRDEGRTIFYVSHSVGQVKRLCNRALVLERGRLGFDGPVDAAIHYLHYDEGDEFDDSPDSDDGQGDSD
jgi:ABC-2 type transport system ATP-binding protein